MTRTAGLLALLADVFGIACGSSSSAVVDIAAVAPKATPTAPAAIALAEPKPVDYGRAGWFVIPRREPVFGRAIRLADGTCVAANRFERWLVTPEPDLQLSRVPRACDGIAEPLSPLPRDFNVDSLGRYQDDIVYFGPSHPASIHGFVPLLVSHGPRGEAVNLDSPIGWTVKIGSVREGVIVLSDTGKLARWSGEWTELAPGGKVTSMVAQDGVVAVAIDEKRLRMSRDGGTSWTDVPVKTKKAVSVDFDASGDLGNRENGIRVTKVQPVIHADFVSQATFKVRMPEGVLALDGLTLAGEDEMRDRISSGACHASGTGLEFSVDGGNVAFTCLNGLFVSGDLGKEVTRLADWPWGVAYEMPSMAGDRALFVPRCADGYSDHCEGKTIRLFTKTASGWEAKELDAPAGVEFRFVLNDGKEFLAIGHRMDGGEDGGGVVVLRVDKDGSTSVMRVDVGYECPSGRAAESPAAWGAHIDDTGDLRLLLARGGVGLRPCRAYARVSRAGHVLELRPLDTREAFGFGAFGQRVIAVGRSEHEDLSVSEDAGRTWGSMPMTALDERYRENVGAPLCGRIGCDFNAVGDETVLWRWGAGRVVAFPADAETAPASAPP